MMKRSEAGIKAHSAAHLKKAFLVAYADTGIVRSACKQTGVGRRTVYDWRDNDPDFAKAFEEARAEAVEMLEAEALRRATAGTLNRFGELEYSDTLLIFLMKGAAPQKYAERKELSGPGGEPLQTGPLVIVLGDEQETTT